MNEPKKTSLDRRGFFRCTAVAAGAATVPWSTAGWAATLESFDAHAGATLLKAARHIYPHPSLADMYYANVVQDLDDEAIGSPDVGKMLNDGVKELDSFAQVPWIELSDGYQLSALKAMESTPFFGKIKGKGITSIYNNPLVWRELGYEGASAHLGGYLNRGFDDLRWLAQPSDDASPRATRNA